MSGRDTVQITEVRVKLMGDAQDRLLAFCSITFDGSFVIRDLKIIKGAKGPFVAMPSRKLTDRCPRCGNKNALRSSFCSQCGSRLRDDRAAKGQDGRAKLYADIAHPINSECRELIQTEVIRSFDHEIVLAQQPGYVCRYDEFDDGMMDEFQEWAQDELRSPGSSAAGKGTPAEAAPLPPAGPPETRRLDPHRRIDPAIPQPLPGPHETPAGRVGAPASPPSGEFGDGL